MGNRIDLSTVDEMTSWLSLPQAAERLHISRQQMHRLAASGYFETLSRIGTFLIVFQEEVEEKRLERGLGTDDQSV